MADEPSIPMDQEEEDNDEYFSARESQSKGSDENDKSTTPTPQRSTRDISPGIASGKSGRQKAFFTDEHCQPGSENSTKKSEKVRRMLKDRNRWDMREYKKEELEPAVTPKKDKKKKKKASKPKKGKRMETEEKSKTDEESDDESKEPQPSSDNTDKSSRPFFQSTNLILKCKLDKPIAPKCKYNVLKFAKAQEVVEYDSEGMQHLLGHYNERAISNPWRRWGAHRALCDQGGFLVDKNKKIVEIKRGSDPPPCPPNPRQVTLNKNSEAPDSQTMMGTLKVEVGQAEEEVHRLGKVMEDYVKIGGFVPPPMNKKEMAAKPVKGGQPQVVVQVKGGTKEAVKGKAAKKKTNKPKKKRGTGEDSDSNTEDDSVVEKAKKNKEQQAAQPAQPAPPVREDSKKGGGGAFGFFKRKKAAVTGKKRKGSIR